MLDLKGFETEELKGVIPKLKGMMSGDSAVNEELMKIFEETDKDESGYLDKSELQGLLEKFFAKMHITLTLTPEVINDAFMSIDVNKDGMISADEFGKFVNAQMKKLVPYMEMELKKRADA